jgi:hypothetical protein
LRLGESCYEGCSEIILRQGAVSANKNLKDQTGYWQISWSYYITPPSYILMHAWLLTTGEAVVYFSRNAFRYMTGRVTSEFKLVSVRIQHIQV